jgi:hypothetical protein
MNSSKRDDGDTILVFGVRVRWDRDGSSECSNAAMTGELSESMPIMDSLRNCGRYKLFGELAALSPAAEGGVPKIRDPICM